MVRRDSPFCESACKYSITYSWSKNCLSSCHRRNTRTIPIVLRWCAITQHEWRPCTGVGWHMVDCTRDRREANLSVEIFFWDVELSTVVRQSVDPPLRLSFPPSAFPTLFRDLFLSDVASLNPASRLRCWCVCVCVRVCVLTRYLKNCLTNQINFGGKPSLWPMDEVIRFWEKSPWGKGGCGWVEIWP